MNVIKTIVIILCVICVTNKFTTNKFTSNTRSENTYREYVEGKLKEKVTIINTTNAIIHEIMNKLNERNKRKSNNKNMHAKNGNRNKEKVQKITK